MVMTLIFSQAAARERGTRSVEHEFAQEPRHAS